MLSRVMKATDFKRVLELADAGRMDEAREVLKTLQDEYLDLCDENKMLRKQMQEVADILDVAENMDYDGQKYWLVDDFHRKGPYCQLCYDRDGLLIRLQERSGSYKCQACGSMVSRTKHHPGNKHNGKLEKVMGQVIPLFVKS